MRVVLDTSAIIYLNDFRKFDEIFTVDSVVKEVVDKISEMKLTSLKLKILEPKKETIQKVESVAKSTGDLEKLSKTDLEILAAAVESDSIIISDDRNIQNVAEKLGIGYISIFNKKITKLIIWKNYCRNCKKFFENDLCPVCGSKLARVAKKAIELE